MTWKASDYFEDLAGGKQSLPNTMGYGFYTNTTCKLCGFSFAIITDGLAAAWTAVHVGKSHQEMIEHLGLWHREEILAEHRVLNQSTVGEHDTGATGRRCEE